MFYILHGEDDFSRDEELKKFRAKMGAPEFAELNTITLEGKSVTLGELQHACEAIPFLADRRMVLVTGLLARFDPRKRKSEDEEGGSVEEESNPDFAKDLIAYLPKLPETTRLFFIENKTLAKSNPVLKFAEGIGDKKKVYVKEFAPLTNRKLPGWIEARVRAKGGAIDFVAVNALAAAIGADLRLLDNEIAKLVTYRAGETIRAEDVKALVSAVQEQTVFEFVDALGRMQTDAALKLLHEQIENGAAPPYLMTMIVRQFRIILQMRDLQARGMPRDVAVAHIKMNPYVATKVWDQAQNFSIARLEAIYQKLLETDLAIKTSRADPVLALDTLVVELTRQPAMAR